MSSPPESITDNYDFYGELLDQYKYDDWTNWINNTLTLLDNCNLTNNLQLINTNNNIQAENSKETDSHPFNSPVNNDILIQYDMDLINQQHQIKPTSSVPELVDSTPYQSDEEQDELSNGLTVSMCEVSASKDYILNEHLQDHTHIMSHYEYHTEDYTSGRQPDNATYETTDISFSELGRYHHTEDHTTTGQTTDAATYEFGRYYHTDTTITTINNDATNDNNNKNIDLLSDNNHDEIEIEEGSFTTVSLNDELTRDNAHSLLPTSILKYSMKNPNKQTLPSESLSGPLSKLSTEIQLERHKMLNEIFYLIQITTKAVTFPKKTNLIQKLIGNRQKTLMEVGDVYYQSIKNAIYKLDDGISVGFSETGYSPTSLWNELYSDVMKNEKFSELTRRYKDGKFFL